MNPMGKHIIERNTTSDNVSYLVDNEKCMCQYKKFTHEQLERGNIFQKKIIEILEASFNKTHIYASLHRKIKV